MPGLTGHLIPIVMPDLILVMPDLTGHLHTSPSCPT